MSEERYVEVWLAALMAAHLKDRAKVVGYALSRFADWDTGRNCYPSDPTLAALVGTTRKTVKRGRDDLEAAGWIVRTGVGRPRNVTDYALVIPASRDKGVPTEVVTSRDRVVPTAVTSRDKGVPTELRQLGHLRPSVGTPEVISRDNVCPTTSYYLLTTVGRGEVREASAPAPGGAARPRPTVSDVRELVQAVVPAKARNGVRCDNPDLADAVAGVLAAGWTEPDLSTLLANMPTAKTSPTGLLIKRLRALADSDPGAVIVGEAAEAQLSAEGKPAPADPLAGEDPAAVAAFCGWTGTTRQALTQALTGLTGQGFVVSASLAVADYSQVNVTYPSLSDAWMVSWEAFVGQDDGRAVEHSEVSAVFDRLPLTGEDMRRLNGIGTVGEPTGHPDGTVDILATAEQADLAAFLRFVEVTAPIALAAGQRNQPEGRTR